MNAGIHLVHKPVGVTSFSLVRQFMERSPRMKFCHGGTLDPFASGLLLILAGQATKLFDHLHDIPKVYEATVRWGIETDNGDPTGAVVATHAACGLHADQLNEVLKSFIGWHEQTPHVTSAKRIAGERAYVRAHRGETFDMPASRVYLHEATWLEHRQPDQSRLRIVTRGGYYVRALARDVGRAVGCGAHLSALQRVAIGPWNEPGPNQAVEIRGRELLPWLPSRDLTDQEMGELRADRVVAVGDCHPPDWPLLAGFPEPAPLVRAFHRERLAFILRHDENGLRATTELRGGA